MRTTLTLDDDVVYGLKRLQEAEPELAFKRIVNETLRKGLNSQNGQPEKKRFKVRAIPIGLRRDLNFDNIEEVLDILEGVNRK